MTSAELIEDAERRQSAGLWRMAGRAGQADGAVLRPLRRAAAGSAGRVEVAALRAHHPRQRHFLPRRLRRQGAGLHPDQSRGRPHEDPRQASREREVPARGRRGNRRRAHRSVREEQAAAVEGRCGHRLRHRNVRARDAHHLHRAARAALLRAGRRGRQSRFAFGRLWRRGAEPDHGHRGDPVRAQGSQRPHPHSGFLRSGGAAGGQGARGLGAAALRRKGIHREGNGRAGTGGRARGSALRAGVGAAHAGGTRHQRAALSAKARRR